MIAAHHIETITLQLAASDISPDSVVWDPEKRWVGITGITMLQMNDAYIIIRPWRQGQAGVSLRDGLYSMHIMLKDPD